MWILRKLVKDKYLYFRLIPAKGKRYVYVRKRTTTVAFSLATKFNSVSDALLRQSPGWKVVSLEDATKDNEQIVQHFVSLKHSGNEVK
jgi:hypothetical protein